MELWTGALFWWKCHWPDLKSAGLFRRNLFLNSLKTSIDCLSSGNPVHVDHASAVKKRIIKILWVDLLCVAFLGLGESACFYWKLCLLVIAVDPAFIVGHQSIKNCRIWIDQLNHVPAIMTTFFFWSSLSTLGTDFTQIFCIFSSSWIIACTVPTLASNCALIVSINTRRPLSM